MILIDSREDNKVFKRFEREKIEHERIIISLNLLEDRTHQDISNMLNMPINTVSTVIARTKQKVIKSLEKMGIGDYL